MSYIYNCFPTYSTIDAVIIFSFLYYSPVDVSSISNMTIGNQSYNITADGNVELMNQSDDGEDSESHTSSIEDEGMTQISRQHDWGYE